MGGRCTHLASACRVRPRIVSDASSRCASFMAACISAKFSLSFSSSSSCTNSAIATRESGETPTWARPEIDVFTASTQQRVGSGAVTKKHVMTPTHGCERRCVVLRLDPHYIHPVAAASQAPCVAGWPPHRLRIRMRMVRCRTRAGAGAKLDTWLRAHHDETGG